MKDSNNKYRITSLFLETNETSSTPLFTLGPYDKDNCISFKRKYMEYEDITEYTPAIALLGSWEHWLLLRGSPVLAPYLDKFRDELIQKVKSESVATIRGMQRGTVSTDAVALSAAKYVHNFVENFTKEPTKKRTKSLSKVEQEEDWERLKLPSNGVYQLKKAI